MNYLVIWTDKDGLQHYEYMPRILVKDFLKEDLDAGIVHKNIKVIPQYIVNLNDQCHNFISEIHDERTEDYISETLDEIEQ